MRCTVCRRLIPDGSKKCPCCGSDFQDGWSTRDFRRARYGAANEAGDGAGAIPLRMKRRRPAPVPENNSEEFKRIRRNEAASFSRGRGVGASGSGRTDARHGGESGFTGASASSDGGTSFRRGGMDGVRRSATEASSTDADAEGLALLEGDGGASQRGGQASFRPRFDEEGGGFGDAPASADDRFSADDRYGDMNRQDKERLQEMEYLEMSDADIDAACRRHRRSLADEGVDFDPSKLGHATEIFPFSTPKKILVISVMTAIGYVFGFLMSLFGDSDPEKHSAEAGAAMGFLLGLLFMYPDFILFRLKQRRMFRSY